MTDLLSWKPPTARATDPETSHLAAKTAALGASAGRMAALSWLMVKPMTDFELADASAMQQTSIGKRRHECMMAGLVERALDGNGDEVRRPAPSGSPSIVWAVTQAGREFYEANTR